MHLLHQANTASGEIASTLKIAYQLRVVSDYTPEDKVTFDANGFSLSGHSDSKASNWLSHVESHKGNLARISRELGIV